MTHKKRKTSKAGKSARARDFDSTFQASFPEAFEKVNMSEANFTIQEDERKASSLAFPSSRRIVCSQTFSETQAAEKSERNLGARSASESTGRSGGARSLLFMLLPSLLFFSYFPVINLGNTDSMHLKLTIPLISIALTTILTLPLFPKIVKSTSRRLLIASLLLPCYVLISLIWSSNRLRTFLSLGIISCLILTLLALPFVSGSQDKNPEQFVSFRRKTLKIFLATSVFVSAFAWLQSILDVAGVSREVTLLCEGCTYQSFGFPHPNAFAIEPQFFGNLLLAPVFLSYFYLYNSLLSHKSKKSQISNQSLKISVSTRNFRSKTFNPPKIFKFTRTSKNRHFAELALAFSLTTTLFFTFSRGAIYSFLLASVFLIVYHLCKRHKAILITLPIILCSATFSLLCQGVFAALSPTTDTFASGVTKSLHHLTLGHLDLRPTPSAEGLAPQASIKEENTDDTDVPSSEVDELSNSRQNSQLADSAQVTTEQIGATPATAGWRDRCPQEEDFEQANCEADLDARSADAAFSGYVSESTEFRTALTETALDLWNDNPKNVLLGVGLGGAGPELYAKNPAFGTAQQIVQNEYVSLLLELGLAGLAVILTIVALCWTEVREGGNRTTLSASGSSRQRERTIGRAPATAGGPTGARSDNVVGLTARSFLFALIVAYLASLYFFSGLPSALHIYLLPLYALLFAKL